MIKRRPQAAEQKEIEGRPSRPARARVITPGTDRHPLSVESGPEDGPEARPSRPRRSTLRDAEPLFLGAREPDGARWSQREPEGDQNRKDKGPRGPFILEVLIDSRLSYLPTGYYLLLLLLLLLLIPPGRHAGGDPWLLSSHGSPAPLEPGILEGARGSQREPDGALGEPEGARWSL